MRIRVRAGIAETNLFLIRSNRYRGDVSKSPYRPVGPRMTAGNMRNLGTGSLDLSCWNCGRRVTRDASGIPDETDLVQWEKRLVCAKCGSRRIDCRPHWNEMYEAIDEKKRRERVVLKPEDE